MPGYKLREITRAGYKSGEGGDAKTNVVVRVQQPTIVRDVEGELDVVGGTVQDANVRVVYDRIPTGGEEEHYGGNARPLKQLSKSLREPGGIFDS